MRVKASVIIIDRVDPILIFLDAAVTSEAIDVICLLDDQDFRCFLKLDGRVVVIPRPLLTVFVQRVLFLLF